MSLNPNEMTEGFPSRRKIQDAELNKAFTANGTLAAISLGGTARRPGDLETIRLITEVTASGGVGAVTVTPTFDYFQNSTYYSEVGTADAIATTGVADGDIKVTESKITAAPTGTYQVRGVVSLLANCAGDFGVGT